MLLLFYVCPLVFWVRLLHTLEVYWGFSFLDFFLMWQLCLGQIIFVPLSYPKVYHRDYIEGIPLNAKMSGVQTHDGISRVYAHCTSQANGVQTEYNMEKDTQTNQCIPDARQTGICQQNKILVPQWELVLGFCVLHLSGAGWSDYPGVCYLLCMMWPSQMALHQQAHHPQVVLELKCWCFQLLPQVHSSHPALCWNWWAVNSSYVGSGCILPHPWGIPNKLVHWGRATFPLCIPYFPIGPVFCDGPWRWLHRLEPCPQPLRLLPCFICHNFFYGIVLP